MIRQTGMPDIEKPQSYSGAFSYIKSIKSRKFHKYTSEYFLPGNDLTIP